MPRFPAAGPGFRESSDSRPALVELPLSVGTGTTHNAGRTYVSKQGGRDFFNPIDYRLAADSDDTSGLQAAATAAIAANGILLITTALTVSGSITLQPASGASFVFTVLATGSTAGITWTGGSSASIFHTYGLKASYITGLKIQVPDSVNNVVGWDVDVDSTRLSSGTTLWERCSYQAGNGTGNIGWRLGHDPGTPADASEESFHWFVGCSVAFASSGTKTGRIGWVNEHNNGLNHCWTNCNVSQASRAFTNVPTAGAGSSFGNSSMFFDNCGGSNNDVEYEFATGGSYKINGGRWENGTTHLSVPMGGGTTVAVEISEDGVNGSGYTSNTAAIFNLQAAVKLTLSGGCRFVPLTGDFNAAMFTLSTGAAGFGSLSVRGCSLKAAAANDQFWTISAGSWSIESSGNTYVSGAGGASKLLAERIGVWNGTVMRANRNGCYAPTAANPWMYNVGTAATANRTYLVKFVPDDTYTITKIGFVITVSAGSNDNVDVGVISGDMQTLVGGSGSVAGKLNAAAGAVYVTGLSISVVAGTTYYAYMEMPVAFGTTAPSLLTTQQASGSVAILLGSSIGQADGMIKDGLAFPFPAPPIVTPATNATVPILGLLKA